SHPSGDFFACGRRIFLRCALPSWRQYSIITRESSPLCAMPAILERFVLYLLHGSPISGCDITASDFDKPIQSRRWATPVLITSLLTPLYRYWLRMAQRWTNLFRSIRPLPCSRQYPPNKILSRVSGTRWVIRPVLRLTRRHRLVCINCSVAPENVLTAASGRSL